jgi:hypothetical protein
MNAHPQLRHRPAFARLVPLFALAALPGCDDDVALDPVDRFSAILPDLEVLAFATCAFTTAEPPIVPPPGARSSFAFFGAGAPPSEPPRPDELDER